MSPFQGAVTGVWQSLLFCVEFYGELDYNHKCGISAI